MLARSHGRLVAITVEGKVDEERGPRVEDWQKQESTGKRVRLTFLREKLGLSGTRLGHIRYQLLTRTAAALIEADRFNASTALMLVHSFSRWHTGCKDYQAFLELFGEKGALNKITSLGDKNGVELYTSWVTGEERYLQGSTVGA